MGTYLAAEAQILMLDFQAARWLIIGQVPQQAGQQSSYGNTPLPIRHDDGLL